MNSRPNQPLTKITTNGLCTGCGLCESLTGEARVRVARTLEGRERPILKFESGLVGELF